jgi:hypothetical protein
MPRPDKLGCSEPYGFQHGSAETRTENRVVAKWLQKSFSLTGAQDRGLRAHELWRLLHARIRRPPLPPFSGTPDLRQRINLGDSLGEASGVLTFCSTRFNILMTMSRILRYDPNGGADHDYYDSECEGRGEPGPPPPPDDGLGRDRASTRGAGGREGCKSCSAGARGEGERLSSAVGVRGRRWAPRAASRKLAWRASE